MKVDSAKESATAKQSIPQSEQPSGKADKLETFWIEPCLESGSEHTGTPHTGACGAEQTDDSHQQQQVKVSACEEHRRAAAPEEPAGPLVISAGWGRTGTSSLKVRDCVPNAPGTKPCEAPMDCRAPEVQKSSACTPICIQDEYFIDESAASLPDHRSITYQKKADSNCGTVAQQQGPRAGDPATQISDSLRCNQPL